MAKFDPDAFMGGTPPPRKPAPSSPKFDPDAFMAAGPTQADAPPPPPPKTPPMDTPASGEDPRGWREKLADKIAGIGHQSPPTSEQAAWRGAQTGVTLGLADRLGGLGGLIGDRLASAVHDLKPNPDAYKASRDDVRDKEKEAFATHPAPNVAGNIAGGSAVSALVAPVFAPLRVLAPGASVPGAAAKVHRMIAATAQPLAEGVAQGVASEKEINGASDVLAGAAKGAAVTAVVGGVVHGTGKMIKDAIRSAPTRKIGNFIEEVLTSEDGNAIATKRLQMVTGGPKGSNGKAEMFDLANKEFPELQEVGRVSQRSANDAKNMVTSVARDKVATRSTPAWEEIANAEGTATLTKAQLLNRLKAHRADVQAVINAGKGAGPRGRAVKGSELERDVIDDLTQKIETRWPGDVHKTRIPAKALSDWSSEVTSSVADKMGTINATSAHQANELTAQIARRLDKDRLAELATKSPAASAAVGIIGQTDRQFAMLKRMERALESKAGRQDANIKPMQLRMRAGIGSATGGLGYMAGTALSSNTDVGKTAAFGAAGLVGLVAAKYGPRAGVWVNDYLLSPMAENIARGGKWKDIANTVKVIGVGAGVQNATLERMYKAMQAKADAELPTYPVGPAPGTTWDKAKP